MKLLLVMLGVLAGAYWFWPRQAMAESCPGSPMSQEWAACRTAVLNACAQLEQEGVAVTYVRVGASGVVDPDDYMLGLRQVEVDIT